MEKRIRGSEKSRKSHQKRSKRPQNFTFLIYVRGGEFGKWSCGLGVDDRNLHYIATLFPGRGQNRGQTA